MKGSPRKQKAVSLKVGKKAPMIHLVLQRTQNGKYVRRSTIQDKTKRINEKLARASAPLYLDIFPISRNISLAS